MKIYVLMLISVLSIGNGRADVTPREPVTTSTMCGVWEAIGEPDLRVFRLEFQNTTNAILAYSVIPKDTYICVMTHCEISPNQVKLSFADVSDNSVWELICSGVGTKSEGVLTGKLVFKARLGSPTERSVSFYKTENQSFISTLHDLAQASSTAIEKYRKAKNKSKKVTH